MKAWYFNPSNRAWVEIRGTSIIGVHLARALGYRVAIEKRI